MTRSVVHIPHTDEHLNLAGEFIAGRGGTLTFDEYIQMARPFRQIAFDYIRPKSKR